MAKLLAIVGCCDCPHRWKTGAWVKCIADPDGYRALPKSSWQRIPRWCPLPAAPKRRKGEAVVEAALALRDKRDRTGSIAKPLKPAKGAIG